MSRKSIVLAGIVVAISLSAASFLLLPRTRDAGPSFLAGASVDKPVREILERACADCHSEATHYPWYSFVPVVSGMIENDVVRGREQLNFSRWDEYPRLRQIRALTGIANQVKDGAMPLPNYLLLHPSARLSASDVEAVFQWAQQERLRVILQANPHPPQGF